MHEAIVKPEGLGEGEGGMAAAATGLAVPADRVARGALTCSGLVVILSASRPVGLSVWVYGVCRRVL